MPVDYYYEDDDFEEDHGRGCTCAQCAGPKPPDDAEIDDEPGDDGGEG